YETAVSQPPIPGAVLLFTPEVLRFDKSESHDVAGNLRPPQEKLLVIDGQHRLAALHFHRNDRPDHAASVHVPCVSLPGNTADFRQIGRNGTEQRHAEKFYRVGRDFLKAAAAAWDDAWGNASYYVTSSVTLKAMIRVCAGLAVEDDEPEEGRVRRWQERLAPW